MHPLAPLAVGLLLLVHCLSCGLVLFCCNCAVSSADTATGAHTPPAEFACLAVELLLRLLGCTALAGAGLAVALQLRHNLTDTAKPAVFTCRAVALLLSRYCRSAVVAAASAAAVSVAAAGGTVVQWQFLLFPLGGNCRQRLSPGRLTASLGAAPDLAPSLTPARRTAA